MGNPGIKVIIPNKPPDMLLLGESVYAKHILDSTTSVLNVLAMLEMGTVVTDARAFDTLALQLNRDKEAAFSARDIALGIAPGQEAGLSGTVLFYIKAARDILLGIYKGDEHVLGDYGYDVNRGNGRIVISRKADKLIELGTNILAKHTLDGAASKIKSLNITDFTAKLGVAVAKNTLAKQLNLDKIDAFEKRDKLLGIDRKQKFNSPGTLRFFLTSVRDVLLGIYKYNESTLGNWGFHVQHGTTPPPAPPTEICLTGIITDINHSPVNNANVKIVQLNVSVQSNAEGIYEFPMQTAGTYTIEVSKQNCETQLCAGIVIKAGTVRNLNVQLNSILGSIIANVFFNGQPLSGAVVAITQINLSAVTDGSGIANLNNIPVGNYNVLATATGKAPLTYPITIELNTISSITFNMVEQS